MFVFVAIFAMTSYCVYAGCLKCSTDSQEYRAGENDGILCYPSLPGSDPDPQCTSDEILGDTPECVAGDYDYCDINTFNENVTARSWHTHTSTDQSGLRCEKEFNPPHTYQECEDDSTLRKTVTWCSAMDAC
jgi:hypothetical protein